MFVTFTLMFHVDLKIIFCRRWRKVYVSLCSIASVCDFPELQHIVVCRQNDNNNDDDNNDNNNNNNKINKT